MQAPWAALGAASWAVVPLKSPATAKSRLAGVLAAEQRRELYFELARRAITALYAARGIGRVLVATASDEAAAFARGLGADVLALSRDAGTAAACRAAAQAASVQAPALLMLAGDLPLVSAAAVERLLRAAAPRRGVTVVPDRHGVGTNALLCRPPALLAPCFGPGSLAAHLALAQAQRIPLQVHRCAELALDLDVVEDLEYLRCLDSSDPPRRGGRLWDADLTSTRPACPGATMPWRWRSSTTWRRSAPPQRACATALGAASSATRARCSCRSPSCAATSAITALSPRRRGACPSPTWSRRMCWTSPAAARLRAARKCCSPLATNPSCATPPRARRCSGWASAPLSTTWPMLPAACCARPACCRT